jgi:hypothetical protein
MNSQIPHFCVSVHGDLQSAARRSKTLMPQREAEGVQFATCCHRLRLFFCSYLFPIYVWFFLRVTKGKDVCKSVVPICILSIYLYTYNMYIYTYIYMYIRICMHTRICEYVVCIQINARLTAWNHDFCDVSHARVHRLLIHHQFILDLC